MAVRASPAIPNRIPCFQRKRLPSSGWGQTDAASPTRARGAADCLAAKARAEPMPASHGRRPAAVMPHSAAETARTNVPSAMARLACRSTKALVPTRPTASNAVHRPPISMPMPYTQRRVRAMSRLLATRAARSNLGSGIAPARILAAQSWVQSQSTDTACGPNPARRRPAPKTYFARGALRARYIFGSSGIPPGRHAKSSGWVSQSSRSRLWYNRELSSGWNGTDAKLSRCTRVSIGIRTSAPACRLVKSFTC